MQWPQSGSECERGKEEKRTAFEMGKRMRLCFVIINIHGFIGKGSTETIILIYLEKLEF